MPASKIGSRWNRPGYEGSLDFYRKDTGASLLTIAEGGLVGVPNPSGGGDYYVDNNAGVDATGDGLSWATAWKTLATAITAVNARTGTSNYAARCRIFYKADSETVNLAALPQKTDIIGVGTCTAYPMASIKGNHAPLTAKYGCRFFNVQFIPATAAVLWTLIANNNGISFYGCQFVGAWSTVTATSAISTTAVELMNVIGCDFDGAFSAEVIKIGTGNASGIKIVDNNIRGGASDGVYVATGATFSGVNGKALIDNNRIYVALITINDVSQLALVTRNRCISAAASGTGGVGAFVANTHLCSDNQITAAAISFMYPLAFDADGTT